MPRLLNATDQPIEFSTGHVVPGRGTLTVSEHTWARLATEGYTRVCLRNGFIVVVPEAPEPARGVTREAIAAARRGELLSILAAHGVTEAEVEGVTVEDRADGTPGLRTLAAQAAGL
jgi:hypothetical protein